MASASSSSKGSKALSRAMTDLAASSASGTMAALVSTPVSSSPLVSQSSTRAADLVNRDLCAACKLGGTLLLCDRCPRSYHEECAQTLMDKIKAASVETGTMGHKSGKKASKTLSPPASSGKSKRAKMEDEESSPDNESGRPSTSAENDEDEWICPKCADPNYSECNTKAARLFLIKTGDEPQSLGNGVPVGRLLQHLQLTIDSFETFGSIVQLAVRQLKPVVDGVSKTVPLQVVKFMLDVANVVGEAKFRDALRACEAGAVVAHGLGTVGGEAPCYNPDCEAFENCRVLRTHCLFCGCPALNSKSLLPLYELDSFSDDFAQIRPKLWRGEDIDAERLIVAERGLRYFSEVATEAKLLEKGKCGDVMFLGYKLWGALRGTSLEDKARSVVESLCESFLESRRGADGVLSEEVDIAEILDTSEALHVMTRILTRSKKDPKQPKVKMKTAAVESLVETLLSSVEQKLLEYDLTDVTGFDFRSTKSPQTPKDHCSNCGMEYPKGSRKLVCDQCKHTMSTKFDYGSLTDAIVWSFVYQSMNSDITCHSRGGKRGTLILRDFMRFLPEARKYKDLDELGEDFWKLQCYFVTHFIYVMSDWGERRLRRELYLEEFRFLTSSLNHAVDHNDPELVGEFLHCLSILGYSLEDGATNQAVEGLRRSFTDALRFLIASEASFDRSGRWTQKNSVAYARYHATWCGIVGLIPHARILKQPPVAFVASALGDPEPRFG